MHLHPRAVTGTWRTSLRVDMVNKGLAVTSSHVTADKFLCISKTQFLKTFQLAPLRHSLSWALLLPRRILSSLPFSIDSSLQVTVFLQLDQTPLCPILLNSAFYVHKEIQLISQYKEQNAENTFLNNSSHSYSSLGLLLYNPGLYNIILVFSQHYSEIEKT